MTKRGDEAPEEESALGGPMKAPQSPLFDGDVKSLKVTKDVNLLQLLDEIDDRLGDRQKYQVVLEVEDHKAPVSETNPLTIHVHPAEVDMRTVRGVVESHVFNADHGKSASDKELEELKSRLAQGDLALPELNKIVRSIIGG